MKKILVNFSNTFIQTFLSDIESYKVGAYYIFPTYHCCQYRNRNGTRKRIQYNKGKMCISLAHTACWRKIIKKYLNPKVYNTRYQRNFVKTEFEKKRIILS